MKKKSKKTEKMQYIRYENGKRIKLDEDDVPELTKEDFAKMRPFKEAMPELYASWKRKRGKQKAPTKQQVTLRLNREVVDYFKSGGSGWQTRLNDALLESLRLN